MYTDELDLEDTDWMGILGIAHFFVVLPLVSICAEIGLRESRSDISKAIDAFQTGRLYNQEKLMEDVGDIMAK